MTRTLIYVALITTLAGCATPEQLTRDVAVKAGQAVTQVVEERKPVSVVRTEDGLHISAVAVDYVPPPKGMVSLRSPGSPLSALVGGLAEGAGLSVSFMPGVDPSRAVTIDLRDADPKDAIREVAYAAGYVAIFDRKRSVTIAREASQTYRVPARLLQTVSARFSVSNSNNSSGNTSNTTGGSNATAQPSTTGQGNQTSGTSNTTGATQVQISGGVSQDSKTLKDHLTSISGAEVNILSEEGLITVRGSASQLRRIQGWLEHYVKDGLTQVEVELSVVEVSLTSAFASGIDWTRVIPPGTAFGSAGGSVNLRTGPDFASDVFSVSSTSRSIESIVRTLETFTTVQELTRPKLTTMNHARTLYRATIQRPYLPSASSSSTPSGNSTLVQTSAAVGYFEEGVTFQVQAHVLDSHRVELTIVPVVSGAGQLERFPLSREVTLTAPVQPRQDALLQVLAEHNRTTVVAGMRQTAGRDNRSGIPGGVRVPGLNYLAGSTDDRNSAREVVMLLHTRIVPAPLMSILVGESI